MYNLSMIHVLIVDDEPLIREGGAKVIAQCMPHAELTVCGSADEAMEKAEQTAFDIAFLDIEMPVTNGVKLAKMIKKISPATNIIFSTAYPQYTGDAMDMHASGYITKPLTADKVNRELADLRHPIDDVDHGLRAQAFGNFEIYYNGEPLHFKYSKTKEMLAYLVDRNCAVVDVGEIRTMLWEDDEDRTSYMKQLRKDLIDTLDGIGQKDAVVVMRGGLGLAPSKIKCDFFDYLDGTPQGINAYRGEYMQQYSWAEATHGNLEMRDYE